MACKAAVLVAGAFGLTAGQQFVMTELDPADNPCERQFGSTYTEITSEARCQAASQAIGNQFHRSVSSNMFPCYVMEGPNGNNITIFNTNFAGVRDTNVEDFKFLCETPTPAPTPAPTATTGAPVTASPTESLTVAANTGVTASMQLPPTAAPVLTLATPKPVVARYCPMAGVHAENMCEGRLCSDKYLMMLRKVTDGLMGTESNDPSSKPLLGRCDLARSALFDMCKACDATTSSNQKLYSVADKTGMFSPGGEGMMSVAVVMGLAVASALAVTLAIARSRHDVADTRGMQQLEATESVATETDA